MRIGGRLAAAIDILDDMARRQRPAADALKDWGLSHRFAGSGDRAAIGNIVYDALRRRRSAGWMFDAEEPRALAFGALMLEQDFAPEAIDAALEDDRFAPPPLSGAERETLARRRAQTPPPEVCADIPDWCVALLQRAYGDDWVAEGRGLAARPPLDMRVNTLASTRENVAGELARHGAVPTALAPFGLRIAPVSGNGRHPNVQADTTFQDGWFEVQDEGSQLAALLAGAAPGRQVLDLCAGAGGKTLALSAAMENAGQLYAHDADRQRLSPIYERLKRADCRNVQVVADAANLAPLEGCMDLVLVDAPCTGSGTWRRRPDAKWRLTRRQLDVRCDEQDAVLADAARFVRPGGRLVYVTCSVFEEENCDRISAFREAVPGFAPVDHEALWRQTVPNGEGRARIGRDDGIRLSPARTDTDGFYIAVLHRS